MTAYEDRNDEDRKRNSGQNSEEDRQFSWRLVVKLGVIARYSNGWTKELNMIEWNGKPAKFDIRDWDQNHERMRKGITLHRAEAEKLFRLLRNQFDETIEQDDLEEVTFMNTGRKYQNDRAEEPDTSTGISSDAGPLVPEEAVSTDQKGAVATAA